MRRAVALVGLLLAAGAALAQQPRVELARSAALDCLSPAPEQRGEPAYPLDAYKAREPGRVHVRLTFQAADLGPDMAVLAREGDSSFVDAVRSHVKTLRVPCLATGAAPAVLDIDFAFQPDSRRVHWFAPVDGDRAERLRLLTCLKMPAPPDYPSAALRAGAQAAVLAKLRFDGPDKPPQVQVFTQPNPGARWAQRQIQAQFAEAVEASARGIRMPCHSGAPIDTVQTYFFRIDGVARHGFKPGLVLTTLLPAVRGIQQQRLAFDTSVAMGCPFDVDLAYRRPSLPNAVAEVGSSYATRRPLLEWLAQVEFDLPATMLDAIYGDTARITVPCLKIDLNPTGVTS